MENLIAQLVGGAVGGLGGAKALPDSNMGNVGNLIAGAVGGLGGGQILGGLLGAGGAAAGGLDLGAIAGNLVGGGVGGIVLQLVVGMVMNKLRG